VSNVEAPFPHRWQIVRTPPAVGAFNMACDLFLMDRARDSGLGILRVYGWSEPTISFGRHERAVGLYYADTLAAAGLDAVRRPTGGRALLHDREITYSVSMPLADGVRWSSAYEGVNHLLAEALLALGVPAVIARGAGTTVSHALPDGTLCFAGVSEGEIAVNGDKLVASAVWRDKSAFLQQGSILLADDQRRLHALNTQQLTPPAPAALLTDHVTNPTADIVADALTSVISERYEIEHYELRNSDLAAIDAVRNTLVQPSWLWRR
jgi:lipoate-protein ligase A